MLFTRPQSGRASPSSRCSKILSERGDEVTLSAAASPVGCLADSVLHTDHQDRRRTHPTTLRSPTHTHLSARVGLCTQQLGQACGGGAHLRRLSHLPLPCGAISRT